MRELCEWEVMIPIVLLMIDPKPKVLFEPLVSSL